MSEWRHNAAEIDQYGYSTGINCEPSNFIGNNTGLQRIANSKCPNMFSDPIQSLPLEFSETDLSANPMARFCYDQGPWNSHQVSAGSSAAYPPQSSYVYPLPARGPNFAVGNYRSAPVSEPESNATANMLSDSGYGTKTFSTVSALSHQMTETNTEYLSLQHQLHNLQPFAVPQHQPHVTGPFDIANPFENNLKSLPDPIPQPTHQCPYCEMSYRCASELKKHILKHEKNYKCREPGCKRNEGFSTPNDLERHKKTVHHIFPRNSTTKMYRCVAEDCKVNGNIWVRPDNFRAHVRRKHGEDRLQELMRLGECYDAVPNQSTNSSIVDQYDHYEEWLDAPQAVNTKNWRQGNVTNWEYKRAIPSD
ncbi:hypothetical protein L228DRAFT_126377 [Xylona heveae TC161]|uniref:C2H2-type domain-containing protein n=1 Tax=Xylona heveae (strain CBS 132557 / TC161) TaxID=1328760 RepID=A0A161U9R9_XYLHT|nr:hypothetical protein L228DRAFT_126377 [Xylona heveae TC161]KZF23895.1 hypothetical protein L228DRAFT_126377 [Xylona heveae TC161]